MCNIYASITTQYQVLDVILIQEAAHICFALVSVSLLPSPTHHCYHSKLLSFSGSSQLREPTSPSLGKLITIAL